MAVKAVLLAQESPPRVSGGIAAYYYNLCRALAGSVAMLVPGNARDRFFDAAQPFPIYRLNMPVQPIGFMRSGRRTLLRLPYIAYIALAQYLLFAWHGWRRLRREPGAMLLAGHLYLAPLARILARGLRRRYAVCLHGGELHRYWSIAAVRRTMLWGLNGAAFLVVNSRHTRDQYRARGVRPDLLVHILHPGVDVKRFQPGLSSMAARHWLGLDGRGPVLLSVARLVEWKGQDIVLRALPRIQQACPGVRYVIAGEGPFRSQLLRLSRELGVEDAVHFAGFVDDDALPACYAASDLVVLPSREIRPGVPVEGFGITLMEAAASSRPVVAGNLGGTADAVLDGVTGLLVDPCRPDAVAEAVLRLLQNPAQAAEMGGARPRARSLRIHLAHASQALAESVVNGNGNTAAVQRLPAVATASALKILQVTSVPLTAWVFLLPLAQALRRTGFTVHFATGPGQEQAVLRSAGFSAYTVDIDRHIAAPGNLLALGQLMVLLRKEHYRVVHAHTPVAGLLARLAGRLAGVPVVLYTLHGSDWGHGATPRSSLYTLAEWLGARCTDRVFVLNGQDEHELVERGFFRPAQVTNLGVGGCGVDLARFDPEAVPAETRQAFRGSLGIPDGVPVIGYLGRTAREKGFLDLLEAFVVVRRGCPAVHLLVAGGNVDGERGAASECEIMAALDSDADLRRQVHITGWRSDVPELLSVMDVLALPSWREGFGMALAEAGAMNLPVVATRTRGGEQAVVHGETGLLVPVRQPGLLAEALVSILGNPALARRMGQAGQRRAREHFSQQASLARQLAVYREICE